MIFRLLLYGSLYKSLKLFAHLPFWFLNGLGYGIYLLLEYLIHYREKIILKNLRNAFPEKPEKEIRHIKRKFYRFFAKLIVENIKMFQLPLDKLQEYIRFKNPELLEGYYKAGKSVAVMAAHYGNWEWLLGLRNEIPHHPIAIYKTLNNKYFDTFFVKHRSDYQAEMVDMRKVPRILQKYVIMNIPTLPVFISDQSPVWEEIQYWTTFLGQHTPVYLGTEKLAAKLNMAVVYFRMIVEPKNRYMVEIIPISEDASLAEKYEITDRYFSLLEEDIRRAPEYWLWSHRRWKLTEKRASEEKTGNFRFEGNFRKK